MSFAVGRTHPRKLSMTPSTFASIGSAVAALFSAIAALSIMFIHRRNSIDAASPEIVIEGWNRETKKNGKTKTDVLTYTKISNVGKGPALHICINASIIINKKPLAVSSTENFPIIPAGKEIYHRGEILMFWENISDVYEDGLFRLEIKITCWSTKNYRYDTTYELFLGNFNRQIVMANATNVAPYAWLTTRTSKSYPIWKLKMGRYFSKLPVVGQFFQNRLN